jgi:hypothetical protein
MSLDDPVALERRMRAWYGAPDVVDPMPAPETIDIPRALLIWYEIAGRWTGARDLPDSTTVMSPDQLYIKDGKLVFMQEYIGDWLWATDPTGDDPAVYDCNDYNETSWRALAPSLSEFLHLFWIYNAVPMAPAIAVRARATADDLDTLRSRLQLVATANWRWPCDVLEFYEADGTLAYASFEADGTEAMITLASNMQPASAIFESIAGTSWRRPRRLFTPGT